MKKLRLNGYAFVVLGTLMVGGTVGCLSDMINELPGGETAERQDNLARLITGDVAEAFDQFRTTVADPEAEPSDSIQLTDEQRSDIEELQGQLDSGEVTAIEFAEEVWRILGDTQPNMALAGANSYGSPIGIPVGDLIADVLQLDDAQRQQAEAIVSFLRSDMRSLRQIARDQILDALNDEQRAALPFVDVLLGTNISNEDPKLQIAMLVFDAMVDQLEVAEEQQLQIEIVRMVLRDGVKGLHESARQQFLMMLDGEQPSILAALEMV